MSAETFIKNIPDIVSTTVVEIMKKGMVFSIDALIAIMIVFGSLYLLLARWHESPKIEKAQSISTEVSTLLFDVKIKDICHGEIMNPHCHCEYDSITALYCTGSILNKDMTILEFIGELYDRKQFDDINDIINETVAKSKLVPENYDFRFTVDEYINGTRRTVQIYPKTN